MTDEDRFLHDVAQLLAVARPNDSAERLTVRLRGRTSSTGPWHKVKVFRRIRRMRKRLNLAGGTLAGMVVETWRLRPPPPPAPQHSMNRCPGCQRCDELRAGRLGRASAWHREARRGLRPPPSHGASGYRNYGCRCATCCAGFRVAERLERLRTRVLAFLATGPLRVPHLRRRAAATTTSDLRAALRWLVARGRIERGADGRYALRSASPGL